MAQCGVHYQLMGSIQRKSDSLLQCATECTCDAVVHLKRPNPENYKTHQNPKTRFLGDNQVFGEFYGFFPKTLFFSGYGCLRYVQDKDEGDEWYLQKHWRTQDVLLGNCSSHPTIALVCLSEYTVAQ